MKPLKLTMRAFGPYTGETVIDFEKLEGRHLFLICGPTGAGKTTILDAMCYALYGKTSGDRTGSHMRSDYASTSQKTEVIFDFIIGGKTYRATRSPEQLIDKKRGKGQTRAAMQASLSELEDGKEVRTLRTGIEEAAGKLIGLNAQQFCQVILLPQGDFRKLLVAKAEDREAILKQLFKTQRFSDFQNELRISMNELAKTNAAEKTELATTFSMVHAADEKELSREIEDTVRFLEGRGKEKERLEGEYRKFRKDYQEAAVAANHYELLEKAETQMAELSSQKEAVEQAKEDLKRIRSAKALAAYFENLEKITADGKKASAQREKAKEERDSLVKELDSLTTQGKALDDRKEEMGKRQQDIAVMMQWLPKAKSYGAAKREVDRLSASADEASKEAERLTAEAEKAKNVRDGALKKAEAIRRDYIFGQAAILASQLKEGEPCPVCGAVHHPKPAISDRKLPTEAEVKRIQTQADRASADYEEKNRMARDYQVTAYVSAVTALGNAQMKLKTLEDVPAAFRDPLVLRKEMNRLHGSIEDWEKEQAEVREKREKAASLHGAWDARYKAADEQREKLVEDYNKGRQALEEKALAEGFKDLAECRSWYERAGDEEKVAAAIRAYEEKRQGTEKVLSDEKAFLSGKDKPDMAALGAEDRRRRGDIQALLKQQADGENRKKQLEEAAARVKDISLRHKKTEKDLSLVSGLYNLARGEKSRISLERYVLGALLDEVAKMANERLYEMSHHRYTLRRMAGDTTEGKGGLTLEVSDSFTGRSRPANTLSGGETFLASLSLALGLADVVQAKQGGVRLDTMFIDEGFGTLDPEALNSAMNTLIDLQNTGRLVGIISHVPELEERIDARLKVTPARNGSTAEFDIAQ